MYIVKSCEDINGFLVHQIRAVQNMDAGILDLFWFLFPQERKGGWGRETEEGQGKFWQDIQGWYYCSFFLLEQDYLRTCGALLCYNTLYFQILLYWALILNLLFLLIFCLWGIFGRQVCVCVCVHDICGVSVLLVCSTCKSCMTCKKCQRCQHQCCWQLVSIHYLNSLHIIWHTSNQPWQNWVK